MVKDQSRANFVCSVLTAQSFTQAFSGNHGCGSRLYTVTLFVKTPQRTLTLEPDRSSTIEEIKARIFPQKGELYSYLPVTKSFYDDKELDDNLTLSV